MSYSTFSYSYFGTSTNDNAHACDIVQVIHVTILTLNKRSVSKMQANMSFSFVVPGSQESVCLSFIHNTLLLNLFLNVSVVPEHLPSCSHMEITDENKTDENILEFPVFGHVHKGRIERMNVITHQQKMEKSTKSKRDSQADASHSRSETR